MVSGVSLVSVHYPLLFLIYTADLSYKINHSFIKYAYDSSLVARIDSPDGRSNVAMDLSSDLRYMSDWICGV